MNQETLDKMSSLRRDGFTMREIAERVSRSERTVRRYVKNVQPQIRMPADLTSDDFTDWFYDQVLASRRSLVAAASEHWDETFELGLEAVDSAMKSLRELLAGMEEVSIRRLEADESLRGEFFDEFLKNVARDWASDLKTIHSWRQMVQSCGGDEDGADF